RVDDTPGENDFALGADAMHHAVLAVFDADGAIAFHQQPQHHGLHFDLNPAAFQRRAQIGTGGARAPAVADGHLQPAEAFLACAVIVVGPGMARRLAGFREGLEQRVFVMAELRTERTIAAAIRIAAAFPAFLLAEIGKDLVIGPALGTVRRPAVEIAFVAAHIGHGIGRGAAAHHLAAGAFDGAAAHARLRLAEIAPIVQAIDQYLTPAERDVNPGIAVPAARLEDQDRDVLVFRQPMREHAARRT